MTQFLFLIMAEGLLDRQHKKQLYQGVKIGTSGVAVNWVAVN